MRRPDFNWAESLSKIRSKQSVVADRIRVLSARAVKFYQNQIGPLLKEASSPSKGGRVVWVVLSTILILLVLAAFVQIDQVAKAPGTVIASQRVQVIQTVDGGVLAELLVKEGDRVEKGQKLASLDVTRPQAALSEIEAKRAGLLANMSRLEAELNDQIPNFPREVRRFTEIVRSQLDLYQGRRQTLREDLRSLEESVRLSEQEFKMIDSLNRSGDASRSEVLRAERQLNDALGKLTNRKNQYTQDVKSEFVRTREEFEQVDQQYRQRLQQLENTTFKAPMSGIVKNVRFTTLGAVLKPSEELLSIVPVDGEMVIEAKVSPRDISLLQPGLRAFVKFDAYDYTIYGGVQGTVIYVSPDSMRDESQQAASAQATYYRVHVQTALPVVSISGRTLDVIPGMTASVDIRTGSRSLLTFLLKPIRRAVSESFTER